MLSREVIMSARAIQWTPAKWQDLRIVPGSLDNVSREICPSCCCPIEGVLDGGQQSFFLWRGSTTAFLLPPVVLFAQKVIPECANDAFVQRLQNGGGSSW